MRFQIPEALLQGFKILSQMETELVERIAQLLADLPVGSSRQDFQEILSKEPLLPSEASDTAEVIFSFGGLLAEKSDSFSEIADKLSRAFIAGHTSESQIKQGKKLKQNLLVLFENSDNLKETFKAIRAQSDQTNVFQVGSINTDIRLLVDTENENTKKSAIIIHQLKIEFVADKELKEFIISADSKDIIELKDVLNKALDREKQIKKEFKGINFLNIK